MENNFSNVYDDKVRAEAYERLEFPGTYYLAYKDLPAIISKHIQGKKAMDFGCGTGRSTRFLRQLGFDVVGVDISEPMLTFSRQRDSDGDYRLVSDGNLDEFAANTYDLVLCAFTFDNIPTMEKKVLLFKSLKRLLNKNGCIVSVVSSPEIYFNEWASFSTKNFPQNRTAKSGDKVFIVMLDVEDSRPVEDIIWLEKDYHETYKLAGLIPIETYKPLANITEPYNWVNETTIAPWTIYVLRTGE
ncbi:MAG: class I SAM-dependent methyltransferase [Ignavibacteriales bacterium]|nr:class I SAM-dependent methyltransferase [Ignavibacteriales bacterium]